MAPLRVALTLGVVLATLRLSSASGSPSPTPSPSGLPPGTQWARDRLKEQQEREAERPGLPQLSSCNETARDLCPSQLKRCLQQDPTSSSYTLDATTAAGGVGVCECYFRHGQCFRNAGCNTIPFSVIEFCENVLLCNAGMCDGSGAPQTTVALPAALLLLSAWLTHLLHVRW